MPDVTEIEALKASVRGARGAADALATVATKVEGTDPLGDIAEGDLDNLQRLSLANAIAAQALRGLVETMLKRRGKLAAEEGAAEAGSGGIDE
jgi:hypothetical protein